MTCPGFPYTCPNLRAVPADRPHHGGGLRCACTTAEGRIPLDEMNSDQLDALYVRAEQAEAAVERVHALIVPWKQHGLAALPPTVVARLVGEALDEPAPAATEATEPAPSPLLDQIYQAMKERYLDNALDLGQTSPKHQIASLANTARAVAVSHGQALAAQHRDAEEQLLAARTRVEEVETERDGAYRERAHLVALLAAMTPGAVIAPAPDVDEPGWQIAYLTIGGRQASWHISPRDAELFAAVEHVEADDPRAHWNGHTTEEKYTGIAAHTAELMTRCGPECAEMHRGGIRCHP
ncbi:MULTISPECIES: hypothetical protein [unclassified Streptomyces]|uniref:hypothetical protein n=1 Tax=unclassified Streptomyces TaxID=2593676 RepID=UPI002E194D18|nr:MULTISPECIES: hypothetical protein [unclassified Streptomyces]